MLEQVESLRAEVFTKITHEFRTPITIILGLSKQLQEQKDLTNTSSLSYLNAIERQGKNLSELVNQLLDMSNLNSSNQNIKWKTGNIVIFTEMIAETFRIMAKEKGIELFFYCEESEITTDFAPDYFKKILHNLLSNAIKYSDEGTRVYLVMEKDKKDDRHIYLKVIDQGKGISKEELPHIFDLFYKSQGVGDKVNGNGVGLALTKQLIEILGGSINVESTLGSGTTFEVKLPIQRSEKRLYPYWKPEKLNPVNTRENEQSLQEAALFSPDERINRANPTILLAEDNRDIGLYTRSIFPEERYNLIYAANGEEALKRAKEEIPDILITDIIMPKMNGIELCKAVKESPLLNHVPIVIISAKERDSDILEGLRQGADSYIKKPFSPEELKVRVDNLLVSRNLLKEKYERAVVKDSHPAKAEVNDNGEFVRHVTDIIYREMKNADFNSTMLAEELAISISQLNKKLNATTGYPSSSYILQVKVDHAKKILSTRDKTIGEVAADCGIYDVNYFSRVFKKITGMTPTQYKRSTGIQTRSFGAPPSKNRQ